MLCDRCQGVGKYLGVGMINIDCNKCDGFGSISDVLPEKDASQNVIDKRSKLYKDAIKDIMKLDPKMSRFEAEKMFDKTYNKV